MIAYKIFRVINGKIGGYCMETEYGQHNARKPGWGPFAAFEDDVCARKWMMDDMNIWDYCTKSMIMNFNGRFPAEQGFVMYKLYQVNGTPSKDKGLWRDGNDPFMPANERGVVYLDGFTFLEEVID